MPGKSSAPATHFTPAEVCRILNLSAFALHRRCVKGEIPFVWRGRQRAFPKQAILALQRESAKIPIDQGEKDAEAVAFLERGESDSAVIRALRLPLERVQALRASLAGAPPRDERRSERDVEADRDAAKLCEPFARRRAELAARRRRILDSEPPPKKASTK